MAIHSGLSGKLIPVHLKPKDDELLSSWLVRLSLAHGLTPREFGNMIRPGYSTPLWNLRDIDLLHNVEILPSLSERCGVPLTRVRETTLSEFEGNLHTKLLTSRKPSYWIMDHDIRPTMAAHSNGIYVTVDITNFKTIQSFDADGEEKHESGSAKRETSRACKALGNLRASRLINV